MIIKGINLVLQTINIIMFLFYLKILPPKVLLLMHFR